MVCALSLCWSRYVSKSRAIERRSCTSFLPRSITDWAFLRMLDVVLPRFSISKCLLRLDSKIRRIWLPLDSKKNLIVPSCAKKQLSDSQSVRASASSDADWHSLGRARAYLSRVSQRKERRKTGELSLRAAPCSDHANGGFCGPIGSTNYWQLHPE